MHLPSSPSLSPPPLLLADLKIDCDCCSHSVDPKECVICDSCEYAQCFSCIKRNTTLLSAGQCMACFKPLKYHQQQQPNSICDRPRDYFNLRSSSWDNLSSWTSPPSPVTTTSSSSITSLPSWYSTTFDTTDTINSNLDVTDNIIAPREKLGIPWRNNNCYMVSILQIFMHCKNLWDAITQVFGQENLQYTLRTGFCKDYGLSMTEQGDANSFLEWLLNKIEKFKDQWKQEFSVVNRCTVCKHSYTTKQTEHMWVLYPVSLPHKLVDDDGIEYDCALSDCIDAQFYSNAEKRCEPCGKTVKVKRIFNIENFSPNLFISLWYHGLTQQQTKHVLIILCTSMI